MKDTAEKIVKALAKYGKIYSNKGCPTGGKICYRLELGDACDLVKRARRFLKSKQAKGGKK